MTKHTWSNRIIPPLVFVGIVSCVWYALAAQPQTPPYASLNTEQVSASPSPKTVISAQPIANVTPEIQKQGKTVHFTLDTTPFKKVQKVEFYLETKLVGAAFAKPFSVQVSENDLPAGTHTIVARIYTDQSTTQSVPVLFTASPATVTEAPDTEDIAPPAKQSATALAAPTGLTATVATDTTDAILTWKPSSAAINYQVWRDGAHIATLNDTTYTDLGLNPGQTYDYWIVAANDTAVSNPSEQTAITMPVPSPDNQTPVNQPDNQDSDHQQSVSPETSGSSGTDQQQAVAT